MLDGPRSYWRSRTQDGIEAGRRFSKALVRRALHRTGLDRVVLPRSPAIRPEFDCCCRDVERVWPASGPAPIVDDTMWKDVTECPLGDPTAQVQGIGVLDKHSQINHD